MLLTPVLTFTLTGREITLLRQSVPDRLLVSATGRLSSWKLRVCRMTVRKVSLYLESMTVEQWLLVAVPILTGGFALAGSWFGSRLGRKTSISNG